MSGMEHARTIHIRLASNHTITVKQSESLMTSSIH